MKKNLSISEKIQNESTQGLLTDKEKFLSEIKETINSVELISKTTSIPVSLLEKIDKESILSSVYSDNKKASRQNVVFIQSALKSYFGTGVTGFSKRRSFLTFVGKEYKKTDKFNKLYSSLGTISTVDYDNFFSVSLLEKIYKSAQDAKKVEKIVKTIFTNDNLSIVCTTFNMDVETAKSLGEVNFRKLLNKAKKLQK